MNGASSISIFALLASRVEVSTDDSPFFTIRLYVYCMRCDNIVIRASDIPRSAE